MAEKHYLTAAEFLSADSRPIEEVNCPELGGIVRVRALSCGAFEKLTEFVGASSEARWTAAMVASAVVDENGEPMFTIDEIEGLNRQHTAPMRRIFDVVNRLNGGDAKTIESIEKNSAPSPSGSSPLN